MKRIIVSGASGFLGKNIISKAHELGIPVVAISSHPEVFSNSVETITTNDFLTGKIKFSKSDVFINCLFPTNADGIKMAEGLKTAYSLIDEAGNSGVGAFINISSQSVYASKREVPATEDTQLSLETPYAVGKYSTEALTNTLLKHISHTNIRLASLLGIDYEQRIVNRLITQALNGQSLKVVGGMQRYGFLDVRDAASGLIQLALSDQKTWKNTYNLGRIESYTLLEVAQTVVNTLKEYGIVGEYQVLDGTDIRNSSLNASLFMKDFAWVPKITFEQTVADIIEFKYKV